MNIRVFIICFLLILQVLPTYISAASDNVAIVRVDGKVTDTLGKPVIAATVVFGKSSGQINYTTTDSSGTFHMSLDHDKYSISISHVAFKDILDSVRLRRDTVISYCMSPIQLDEVVVTADYVKQRGSGFTVMAKGNPLASGRSLLSFINTFSIVRGVSVNNRPSSVYINGRELKMNPSEIINFLATIPAENIEKVRVRTTAGPSRKNTGLQSAIEITLVNSEKEYCSGMATVSPSYIYGSDALTGNAGATFGYFNRRLSSLTYLNFNGSHGYTTKTESLINGTNKETSESRQSLYALTLDQSLVYDIDKNHSVGVGLNLFYKPADNSVADFFSDDIYTFTKEIGKSIHREDIFFNYKYTFGERRSTLRITADILNSGKDYKEDYTGMYENNWQSYADKALNMGISADMQLFVSDMADLSFGVSYTSMLAERAYSACLGAEHFKFSEGNIGAYAEFYTPLFNESLDLTVGFRFEQYFADVTGPDGMKRIRKWDLFPTLDLTYMFKKDGYYLSLMYDKGIYRPYMSDYLPFVTITGERMYDVGGLTDINPEYESSVSLIQTLARNHTIGLSYNWTDDYSDAAYALSGDTLYSVWSNSGTIHEIGMYLSSKFWIVKNIMSANVFVEGSYVMAVNNSRATTDMWECNASLNLGWAIPKGWSISAYGRWSSPTLSPVQKTSGYWAAGMGVAKSFKKGWRLSLRLNEIFNRGYITRVSLPDPILRQKTSMNQAGAVVTLTYMFSRFSGKKASNMYEVRERSLNN